MADLAYHLRQAPMGLILLDRESRVGALSGAVPSLLGLEPGRDLVGQAILDLHPPGLRPKVAALLEAARSGGDPAATTLILPLPAGPIAMRVCALPPDSGTAFALILTAMGSSTPATEPPAARPRRLPVEDGGGTAFVALDEVVYVQADGHYSRVHTARSHHFCPLSLAEVEKRLDPAAFVRVHRSYLVALERVRAFRKRGDGGQLVMDTGEGDLVPVGRDRLAHLRTLLAF